MDWLVTLGIVVVAAGTVFATVIGIAVHDLRGHLRRGISDASNRQALSLRKVTDNMAAVQKELREAQAQLGDENKQVLMRYMVYGSSIAGGGLLAGLILPTLLRVRRKRNDQWV